MMLTLIIILVFTCLTSVHVQSYIIRPGPAVEATRGEVWPKPKEQVSLEGYYILSPAFEFEVLQECCSILEDAVARYTDLIGKENSRLSANEVSNVHGNSMFIDYLNTVGILLTDPCKDDDLPTQNVSESYFLNITSNPLQTSYISSDSVWGILRGLETFSQLLHAATDQPGLKIRSTFIYDTPNFAHRGLLMDTSRHFLPVNQILPMLDAMSYNKLNVFHWHITDDQSFPYESKTFPELSKRGAYYPTFVYTATDVQDVIEYARKRGIRVMVEFDTPGHTRSWGEGVKDVLTPCYDKGKPSGEYGPMNPMIDFTYSFLKEFYEEVIQVFPNNFVHLGGDEVEFECWASNPDILNYMKANNISDDYAALESIFITKLLEIVGKFNVTPVLWEEVFVNNVSIPKSAVIHVWKPNWVHTLNQVTKAGYRALLSSCWYLDHLANGGDWKKFYECNPSDFLQFRTEAESEKHKKLLLGGEACMWSEVVNQFNIQSRVWPRASATAEKLWSWHRGDTDEAAGRLEEHTCRMNRRGIAAQPPNGPGFCSPL